MKIITFEHFILKEKLDLVNLSSLKQYYAATLSKDIPYRIVRFVVTKSDERGYYCEIDAIVSEEKDTYPLSGNVFDFRKREHENTDKFTTVLLIPTGIGAEIGGHCGDGNSVARLIGARSAAGRRAAARKACG